VVVGKQGEEIWTDQYGRIKIQFHWDRQGKADENSSCWVRVAQFWAGKKWGSQFLPRIGQEVVVEFLEGDPDQPLVTGSVFNADHMPPYELPANMTQSGVKTRSTKTGNDKTFNELRFEDKKDSEQVYLHAEKDFDRVVENSETAKIGFDKKDKGDQITEVYNDCTLSVEKGNHSVTVKEKDSLLTVTKGKRTVTIKDDCSLTVESGNRMATIKEKDDVLEVSSGNQAIQIKQGDHTLKIDSGKSTIEAGTSIELKVGSSSIKIEAGKITIKSNEIVLDGGSKVDVKGDMIQAKASGQMVLKGSMVKIN
jgi:type VI secretion system secreted protein VgrG